jgi:hypothetical protein
LDDTTETASAGKRETTKKEPKKETEKIRGIASDFRDNK